MKPFYILALILFISEILMAQGITTSSMSGHVEDKEIGELIGVNIIATHTPTGSVYGTTTDLSGNFRMVNMKIGGPYKIELSYVGYKSVTLSDIYLKLGEQWNQNFYLNQDNVMIDGIEIIAQVGFAGQSTGASSQISEEDVLFMPSVDRELDDLIRLTPQVKESFGEGISIAGMNNRFNAIYIDGAVNNDVFGLSPSGTNGGQTGISPISPEIIDQIQVVISPFDVSYGGFAGGGINVVTKSGTNNLFGSAYYYQQNESLVGKDNQTLLDRINEGLDVTDPDFEEAERVADFTDQVYGFTLGGPIIKDKLFFFFNGEIQDDETPIAFDFAEYQGNSTLEDLENLRSHLISKYDYDPGNFLEKADRLDGAKWFLKLDYNINENHKLSFRHQYTNAEEYNVNTSNSRTINFENNGVFFPSTTNSSAIELNSNFGNSVSNNLIIGYTQVKDDRDPLGKDFPNVTIEDGNNGNIRFGSEGFSSANQLDQNILTITDNLKWFKGDHTFTFGTHNEISSFYNLFIRQNFGEYDFADLASFLADDPIATDYFRSYSLVDELTGDGSAAAAEFTAVQFGLYAQDEWRVNPDLTFTFGLRLDVPFIVDDQEEDTYFNTTTLPLIKEAYPLVGEARSGTMPEGQLMWSPRVGFNYDLSGNNSSVLRGGVGLFTSRIPFVWPGGAFINNGLTIGDVDARDINPTENTVPFIGDPNQQYTNPNFAVPSGQMDLYASDFKYPQILRASLAYDRVIGNGWKTSFEAVFTKTINNIFYQNVNSDPEISFYWTNTPDNRPVYVNRSIDNTYSAVYFANNTSEGYAYNLTTSLEKNIIKGLNLFAAYTYGDARSIFEGTSSQNSSQWRGSFNVNGRNNSEIGRSDFAPGHRIISALSYKVDWGGNDDFSSVFSLFYEGESGSNYSYIYGFGSSANNINGERGITSRNRSLIFIPETPNDIHLVEGDLSAAEQWDLLDAFIENDPYLSKHRGEYAEKNGARTPFESQIDFKYLQNLGFSALGKGHRLQLSFDVENFANLINSSWGVVYSNPFDYGLIAFEGLDGTVPQFSFEDDRIGNEKFFQSNFFSRWRARVGVRYFFE